MCKIKMSYVWLFTIIIICLNSTRAEAACLEGKASQLLCDGPLHEMTGGAENAVTIVAAAEPPCGIVVSDEGPALYPMPRNGQWGYVTRDGEWVIEPNWAYAEPFSEGRAAVNYNGRWGVIDRAGNYVLEPVLRSGRSPLQPFSEGCSTANVQKDGSPHPFFIDRDGRFWLDDALPEDLSDRDVWEFGQFSGGRAWFRAMGANLKESYGWIDKQGKVVLKDDFSGAGEFVDGRAPAASGGDWWAFIDTEGNPVLPRKWAFKGARPFSEGLAAAEAKQFRWMYFDTKGAIAIDRVKLVPPRQVIGKTVSELNIGAAGDFHDGLAPVIPSMMFDAEELVYIRPDGTEAFAPGSRHGLNVCQPGSLPEYRDGLLQILVANEGAECGDAAPGRANTRGNVHYLYLDTTGDIVLRELSSE